MPTVFQELAADEFDYDTDWKEMLDPACEDNITNSAMEASLTGVVSFNKIRACARYFLGFSYASTPGDTDYVLYREPPSTHPRWPNLYAHGVSFRPFAPKANPENASLTPTGISYPYITDPFTATLHTSNFDKVYVTIRYRSFGRMRFLPDEDIADYTHEWKRWVSWQTAPRIEALSAEGGSQLKFAEAGSFFDVTGPTAGVTPFAAPVAVLLAKCAFVMTWMHVPHDYISSDPDILIPDRILHCMGKTNSDTFQGFAVGVLLMDPPTFEPVLFPVVAADSYDLITGWNVHIPFQYSNPDMGPGDDPNPGDPPKRLSVTNSTYRGHNLMPFRNGGFYLATRNGEVGGPKLLPEAAFTKIFQHVSDDT